MPNSNVRCPSGLDVLIERFDSIFRIDIESSNATNYLEDYPRAPERKRWISESEKCNVVALMRVNHAGEVSAQGLYLGQALFARDHTTFAFMKEAASEERRHLVWCSRRLEELSGSISLFTQFWFFGSFFMGALISLVGDQKNLGFVEETEKQVSRHLEAHLSRTPLDDHRTRQILQQMREDELEHGSRAQSLGALEPPYFVKQMMGAAALVMKEVASKL